MSNLHYTIVKLKYKVQLKMLACLGKGLEAGVLCACVEFRLSHESIPVLWRCSCCTVDLSRSQSQWISILHYGHSRYPLQHGDVSSLHCSKNFVSPRLSFAFIKPPLFCSSHSFITISSNLQQCNCHSSPLSPPQGPIPLV